MVGSLQVPYIALSFFSMWNDLQPKDLKAKTFGRQPQTLKDSEDSWSLLKPCYQLYTNT